MVGSSIERAEALAGEIQVAVIDHAVAVDVQIGRLPVAGRPGAGLDLADPVGELGLERVDRGRIRGRIGLEIGDPFLQGADARLR